MTASRSKKCDVTLLGALLLISASSCRPAQHTALPEITRDVTGVDSVGAGSADAATAQAPDAVTGVVAPAPGPLETFRQEPVRALLDSMRARPVLEMERRYNHTHPVYRLRLEGGMRVGVRPSTADRPDLWRNDIAGYVLARLLGIAGRVPPATSRTIPMDVLEDHMRFGLRHVRGARPRLAFGSVIYWMPQLLQADVFWGPVAHHLPRWLSQAYALPPDVPARAEEISTLMVFDALQGNVDRWHPNNLQLDEHGVVVYRDNSEAWRSSGRHEPFCLLRQCERFSRALLVAVRRTNSEALTRALAPEEAFGEPILRPTDLADYEDRRRRALAYIDTLIARYGEAAVLPWP